MPQQLWSRERFESFLKSGHVDVYLAPARAVPCECRDLNCHGWRLERVDVGPVDAAPREWELIEA